MPFRNPAPAELAALFRRIRRVAVVGLSNRSDRISYGVSHAMQSFGFDIVPVNPQIDEALGQKAYPDLDSLPAPVDCVNVYRRAEELDAIVEAAIRIQAPVLWIQEGIVNEAAALRAQAAGLTVVMDRCIYKDYLAYGRETT